jgi:hypothetical protein
MTINAITSNLDRLEGKAPLYQKYSGQFNPQPAYIELDCRNGELMADYSGEIGNAVPFYYWHGLAVRWDVSAETSGASIRELFANQGFLETCQRILDGFDEHWDGNNHVGHYNDDAAAASEDARLIIDRTLEFTEVWNASDWLFNSCKLKDHWADQPIDEAVADCEFGVEANQYVDGIEDALIEQAKIDFEYSPETLTRTHINELLKREEISQADADEWIEENVN